MHALARTRGVDGIDLTARRFARVVAHCKRGVLAAILVFLHALGVDAVACTCGRSSIEQRFSEADVVVIGRAVAIEDTWYAGASLTSIGGAEAKWLSTKKPYYEVTIEVIESFKGNGRTYRVLMPYTPGHVSAPCPYGPVWTEEQFLFYIYRFRPEASGAPAELLVDMKRLNRGKPDLFAAIHACSYSAPARFVQQDISELRKMRSGK